MTEDSFDDRVFECTCGLAFETNEGYRQHLINGTHFTRITLRLDIETEMPEWDGS